MAGNEKKSDDINGNYPLVGWRLQKEEAEKLMKQFKDVERIWNKSKAAPESGYKRNGLFYKALMIGLAEMKKNPPR